MSYNKSTSLEGLGPLAALCSDPARFLDKVALFIIDNMATVICLEKGYSKGDLWATTILRAARVVAAGIGCTLQAVWEPRRSSRPTRISDNLTHNRLEELEVDEIESYLSKNIVSFPEPIIEWMSAPQPDQSLGRKCLLWMRKQFPSVMENHPVYKSE